MQNKIAFKTFYSLHFVFMGILIFLFSCNKTTQSTFSPRFAYITNDANDNFSNISKCEVNSETGLFKNCVDAGPGSIFNAPTDLKIQTFSGIYYAYIGNFGNGGDDMIWQCVINPNNGILYSCGDSGAGPIFTDPGNLSFQKTSNGNLYAYVVNQDSPLGSVSQCLINQKTGKFISCVDSGVGAFFSCPLNIAFNTIEDQIFAYVTEGDCGGSNIAKCNVNKFTGQFNNCVNLRTTFNEPVGIFIDFMNRQNFAYITNVNNGTISQCEVSSSDGEFFCNEIVSGFSEPANINIIEINNNFYAYIPYGFFGLQNNTVSQCQIDNTTGNLFNCKDSGVGSIFNFPFSVTFF